MQSFWLGNLVGLGALVWLPYKAFQHDLVPGGHMWLATLIAFGVFVAGMVFASMLPLIAFGIGRIGCWGALVAAIVSAIVGEPQAILPMVVVWVGGLLFSQKAILVARKWNIERPIAMG